MITFLYKIYLRLIGVEFGRNLKIRGIPVIVKAKGASIKIGSNVTIKSSFLSNLVGLYQRIIIVARVQGAKVIIGDNVGISGSTIYARDSIEIGDDTIIGANTKIMDNDFHPTDPEKRLSHPNEGMKTRKIIIGHNVFIGCNAIVLKGTLCGNNCVIGAGSVLTGGIYPANSILAGNPAKLVRTL